MRALALAILIATPAFAKDLSKRLADVDRVFVNKLVYQAKKARRAKCHRTEAGLLELVLRVNPDHSYARRTRGFKKVSGKWVPVNTRAPRSLGDEDRLLPGKIWREVEKIEKWRVAEVVRVCEEYGGDVDRRNALLDLLDKNPGNDDIHRALGHRRVGRSWVRPELEELVQNMPAAFAAWRRCLYDLPKVYNTQKWLNLKGGQRFQLLEVGTKLRGKERRRKVCSDHERLGDTAYLAQFTVPPHRLIDELLGIDAVHDDPDTVVFVRRDSYERILRAALTDPDKLKIGLGYTIKRFNDMMLISAKSYDKAKDFYAHSIGYATMGDIGTPTLADGKRHWRANAWLKEGFGYLLSLELYNSAELVTSSAKDSEQKRRTREPPEPHTRRACLTWLREQVIAGYALDQRELFSRSINSLDFTASLQAYSLLRFLFLYNPSGAANFPHLLAKETKGSQFDRTDRALRKAFGMGSDEIETLWRAFIVEIEQR